MRAPSIADPSASRVALSCLVHPWSLLALALLALNDHWLKGMGPGWLTGKQSDFAGLFYFPFLVVFFVALLVPRSPALRLGRLVFWGVGIWFAAAKTLPWVHELTVQLAEFFVGEVQVVLDPTDVIAVVSLVPAWALYKRMAHVTQPRLARQLRPLVLGTAVLLTAATSKAQNPSVEQLVIKDGLVYAVVVNMENPEVFNYEIGVFSTTTGLEWQRTTLTREQVERYRAYSAQTIPGEHAQTMLTLGDVWRPPDGRKEFTRVLGAGEVKLRGVVVLPQSPSTVVMAMGTEGIVVADLDGTIKKLALGGAAPTPSYVEFDDAMELVALGQWLFGFSVTLVAWMFMSLLTWCNMPSSMVPSARVMHQKNLSFRPSLRRNVKGAWGALRRLRFFNRMIIGVIAPLGLLALNLQTYPLTFPPVWILAIPFLLLSLASNKLAWRRFLKENPEYQSRTHFLLALVVGVISTSFLVLWDMAWIESSTTAFVLSLVLMTALILWHAAKVGTGYTPR